MPRPTIYAAPEQPKRFGAWLDAQRQARRISKSKIATELGHDSIQHVNKMLRGETVPMPATIRKVCEIIGIAWPEAIVLAGHIDEVLYHLASLKLLGDKWRREDDTFPAVEDHLQFRSLGVAKVGPAHILNALHNDASLASRYIFGFWDEDNSRVQFVGEPPPPMVQTFMRRPRVYGPVFMPKPLALAIAIVGAGFPRRGDVWRNGCETYAAVVLNRSAEMFELAESVRPRTLPPLLRQASDVLKDKLVQYDDRRNIAAEYMNAWADAQNMNYTHIIRLAAYARWGESGSRVATVSAFPQLPQIRKAQLPKPSALALHATSWTAGVRIPKLLSDAAG